MLQPLKLCHTLNFIRKNVGASFKQLAECCKCSTCPASASASALGAAGVANECCQSERQRQRVSERDVHVEAAFGWSALAGGGLVSGSDTLCLPLCSSEFLARQATRPSPHHPSAPSLIHWPCTEHVHTLDLYINLNEPLKPL